MPGSAQSIRHDISSTDSDLMNIKFQLRKQLKLLHRIDDFKTVKDFKERIYLDKYMKNFVFNLLYFALLNNGKNIDFIFYELDEQNIPKNIDDISNSFKNDYQFYENIRLNENLTKSHKGRNCGRKFKHGEPIYRCQECGFDDTCVLCINCFEPNDHLEHHVYIDICDDNLNTGICDCGDVEAWNNPLTCKAENEINLTKTTDDLVSESNQFNNEFNIKLFEIVLAEIFDYFIDVFNQNVEPLFTLQNEITTKLRSIYQNNDNESDFSKMEELINTISYSNEFYEADDDKNGYAVIVYNDEYHNYSQATTALRHGKPDNKHIDLLTSRIDGEGRTVLKCSKKLDKDLIDGFFAVQSNGLTATLINWQEYIHQKSCKYIISWLSHCLSIENPNFQNVFRNSLSKVLCSPINKESTVDMSIIADSLFIKPKNADVPTRYNDLSLLDRGIQIPKANHKFIKISEDNPTIPLDKISDTQIIENFRYTNSRLQLILYFDNRYWKSLRRNIQNLIVPTLASNVEYKKIFCDQFIEVFNHMINSVTYKDREPQLTILKECIVQLLTCPTNVDSIVNNNYKFQDILWTTIDIFNNFTKRENGLLIWQRIQKINPTKSYNFVFKQTLYLIEILLGKITNYKVLLNGENFIAIVNFIKLLNGNWKLKRKEGEHVLHEDQHFIPYLEYTTYIYNITEVFNKVLLKDLSTAVKDPLLSNAIMILTDYLANANSINLNHKSVSGENSLEIIKFDVDKEKTSYMNPISTLYSILIDKVPVDTFISIINKMHLERKFINVSDVTLRTVILCSQIVSGYWIRNGMSVLHQISYYKNNPELDSYSRDIHLVQMAAMNSSQNYAGTDSNDNTLSIFIYNMIDRWGLLDWFTGAVDIKNTIYHDKIFSMIQQFISFCYHMLTDRQFYLNFKSYEDRKMYFLEKAITYNLYPKPLSYSKLLKSIPDYLIQNNNNQDFDVALEEITIFEEPKGLSDNGVYKLNRELYSRIDPLNVFNMGNDFETSAVNIKSNILGKSKNTNNVILEPYFADHATKINVGDFSKTNLFGTLIKKLLFVEIEHEDSTYLYELLHFIHAIFKDEKIMTNIPNAIPEVYIDATIIGYLIKISDEKFEKKFSEHIVSKAKYLIEQVILYDSKKFNECLVAEFGEEYVIRYTTKRNSSGSSSNDSENENAKKRRLAKKRQKKLLERFNTQQNKFMKENESEFNVSDGLGTQLDKKDNKLETKDVYTCSLCQDNVDSDVFVIPAYHGHTPIFRSGDIFDIDEFVPPWNRFFNNFEKLTYTDNKTLESLNTNGSTNARKVFVSCNHSVHSNCFKRFILKKRFSVNSFICPLCQTYSNCVFPITNSSDEKFHASIESLLNEESSIKNISKLFSDTRDDISSGTDDTDAMNSIVLFSIFHANSFDSELHKKLEYSKSNVSQILSVHWANTISMLEISSRLDQLPYVSFLSGREQKYKTLKNILSFIILVFRKFGKPDSEFKPYDAETGIWCENQLFQYIIYNFLFSKTSLKNIITTAISEYAKQLALEFMKGISSSETDVMFKTSCDIGDIFKVNNGFKLAINKLCDINSYPDEAYRLVYTSLLKNILPTLRRCLIILKVIHDTIKEVDDDPFILNNFIVEDLLDITDLPVYIERVIGILTNSDSLESLLRIQSPVCEDALLRNLPYEYCGIIKMIDLAKCLNNYVTNSKQIKLREEHSNSTLNIDNRLDFKICLTCGVKVHMRSDHHEMSKHLQKYCFKPYGAFLIPNTNEVCLFLTNPPSSVYISAPYLNSHGETGKNAMRRGDLTTLNLKRYEYLNSLWINNEIPGYVSRVMGDDFRLNILTNGFLFAFNRQDRQRRRENDESDDENDDGDEDDENPDSFYTDEELESDANDDNIRIVRERMMDFVDDAVFAATGGEGTEDNPAANDVRRYFEAFENFRNTVVNGAAGEETTILDLLSPRLANENTDGIEDENESDDIRDGVDDAIREHHGFDDDENNIDEEPTLHL